MPALNHTHTYRRIKKYPNRYMCGHPECTNTMDKSLLLGKKSLCNICGKEYILTHHHLKRAMPNCGCVSGKAAPDISAETELLKSIMEVKDS